MPNTAVVPDKVSASTEVGPFSAEIDDRTKTREKKQTALRGCVSPCRRPSNCFSAGSVRWLMCLFGKIIVGESDNSIIASLRCKNPSNVVIAFVVQKKGGKSDTYLKLGTVRLELHARLGLLPHVRQLSFLEGSDVAHTHAAQERGEHLCGRWFERSFRSKDRLIDRSGTPAPPAATAAVTAMTKTATTIPTPASRPHQSPNT